MRYKQKIIMMRNYVRNEESNIALVTVGIVVLNREWIIDKMLDSLLRQNYPHNRIFVVIVDGGSKDKTVEVARKILGESDFKGYEIITRECSIPEGRNICIEKMQGDMLLFWDSDVIMKWNAIQDLVRIIVQKQADIVSAEGVSIFVNAIKELDAKIDEALIPHIPDSENHIVEVPCVGMGHTLVSGRVFSSIRFDPDLTISEDLDLSVRAREKGFRIVLDKRIQAFDINIRKKGYSDIHIDMPLKSSLRGLRKKAKAHVLAYSFTLTFRKALNFFYENKRYVFYFGYMVVASLTIYGLLESSYLIVAFPVYLLLFAFWQIKRRGVKRGIKALLRSIAVGVPFSLMLIYYFSKYALRRRAV